MTTHTKMVLPSFSIFRKRKGPFTTGAENASDCGFKVNFRCSQSDFTSQNNELPENIISFHNRETNNAPDGCFSNHHLEIDLQVDIPEISKNLNKPHPDQNFSGNTFKDADQHHLYNVDIQCENHQAASSDIFGGGSHLLRTQAPPENFLETPGALLGANGNQSFWTARSSSEYLADYGLNHQPENAFSVSSSASGCLQLQTANINHEMWSREQTECPMVCSTSLIPPMQGCFEDTFYNQTDLSISPYTYLDRDTTAKNLGGHTSSSSVSYVPNSCPSSDACQICSNSGQKLASDDFQGFCSYVAVNNLEYNHDENSVKTGDQLCRDDAPYAQHNGDLSLAPTFSDIFPESDSRGILHPPEYDKSSGLQNFNISNRSDNEGDENETGEGLDNGDEYEREEDQRGRERKGNSKVESYIALISKAILDSPEGRLQISDIYTYIRKHTTGISTSQKSWQNTVRHNLSLNECFVKQVRQGKGRGHYWMVHPACVEDFLKGNYRRRQARRRAKKCPLTVKETNYMAGQISEQNRGPPLPIENDSELQTVNTGAELWGVSNQPTSSGIFSEIAPANIISSTEIGIKPDGQPESPNDLVGNVYGAPLVSDRMSFEPWFVGGEAISGTTWFEVQ